MLEVIDHGPVRELRLARPPVNALDVALLEALDRALLDAATSSARAMVLSGRPGVFSGGLDVPFVVGADAAGIEQLVTVFSALQRRIATSPLPLVAAITGHAPAGGAVLTLYCDRRIMARGAFRIGLNEVQVGLFPGRRIYRAYARLIGEARAADLLARGVLLGPDEACSIGLVDELVEPAEVVPRALAFAAELAALPPQAYARTRALVRESLLTILDLPEEIEPGAWVTAETRACMARALQSSRARVESNT